MNEEKWYLLTDPDQVDSPALLVYPARVKQNISILVSMVADISQLRPHAKTHKTREATLLMLEAGIRKFKCATIAEAEMLAMAGAGDVLLAYQPHGPKLIRFLSLIKKYPSTKFSCLVDNEATARLISETNRDNEKVRLFIDLNVGMNRTGIKPDKAVALYENCTKLKGIDIIGLHVYDGHVSGTDMDNRRKLINEIYAPVKSVIDELVHKGCNKPQVVAGGSPSFPVYAEQGGMECSPGTFIFWDKGYSDALPEQGFLPAAVVMSRVISMPDETKICLDLGHKSVASENELNKRVFFINAPELKFVGHSEEHLVAEAGKNHPWRVGDVLYGIPYHVCPTVALHDQAVTVEEGKVTGAWEIVARKRRLTV